MIKKRELWVDNLKIFACVLVVLGHLFQSMVSAGIMSESFLYTWFDKTIYYFHVPLFFICSGYLYQKYTDTSTFAKWGRNVANKAVALMIPYFVFSVITWVLKNVFADSVNQETDGLFTSLFLNPISPYWYLFALFFIFVLIPVMKDKASTAFVLIFAALAKIFTFIPIGVDIYILNIILGNIIWFVLGMCLVKFSIATLFKKKLFLFFALFVALLFDVFSFVLAKIQGYNALLSFFMGLAACFVFVVLAIQIEDFKLSEKLASVFARYTLPVFLMHTIFAAAMRSVLNKLGVTNSFLHIMIGLLISFAGPVVTYMIASRIKFLDFFLSPNKYIKISKKN
ncbi:MAG: acyltransferase [Ruminococcaceae bacterium]|nr:acyltransferase [Oscillospiraceae bacterium]